MSESFLKKERTVREIRKLRPSYLRAIADSSCDKYEWKINGDSRFKVFEIPVYFSCLTGHYGSSGCSTFGSIGDKDIFREAFLKYLDRKLPEILEAVANDIEASAATEREAYLAKLRAEIERVEASATGKEES